MLWVPYVTMFLLMMCGLLLIFIILLQRGRGGGLAGALGGMGGQSAFGTKAGDVFTRITVGLAIVWVVLAAVNVYALNGFGGPKFKGGSSAIPTAPSMDTKGETTNPMDDENLPPAAAPETTKPDAAKPETSEGTSEKSATDDKPKSEQPAGEKQPDADKPAATSEPAAKPETPVAPAEKTDKPQE